MGRRQARSFERRIERHLEQHTEQCNHGIVVSVERAETLGKMIETERTDRQKEVKAAVEETKRAVEAKLEALEQHIERHTEQCGHGIAVSTGRAETLGKTIEMERADRQKEIKTAVEETRRTVEAKIEGKVDAKLSAQEARFKALLPDKLPIAKTYCPDTVHYGGEVVVHHGATYQALRDTARAPPHADDWVCLARAGRDAVTPTIRGTYDVNETYKALDIVVMDGASFIARKDNPGGCPGSGDWQLASKQGRPGRKGERGPSGPAGPKGDKGEPIMPALVSSKIDENYNLVILRSDKSLEIIPLREAFERYDEETRP